MQKLSFDEYFKKKEKPEKFHLPKFQCHLAAVSLRFGMCITSVVCLAGEASFFFPVTSNQQRIISDPLIRPDELI